MVEEYQITGSTQTHARTLTWGRDLGGSPSLQAAGGVGGLLMVEEITGSTTTAYHFHYDGNGNVTEITNLTGTSAARYRYDAFGNTLVATGPYAAQNRYRFSTKPLDSEVASAPLYYYGYRFYDPVTGRWPSRDPIGERGGKNLYGFLGNSGTNQFDLFGLCSITIDVAHGGFKDSASTQRANGRMNDKDPGDANNCDRFIAVGCGANRVNNFYNSAGIGVPTQPPLLYPVNNGEDSEEIMQKLEDNGFDRNDLCGASELPSHTDLALENARRQAKKLCEAPCCCKEITIKVTCQKGGDPSIQQADSHFRGGSSLCGHEETVSCK